MHRHSRSQGLSAAGGLHTVGPGKQGTRSARKLAVVSKSHTFELGRFSTSTNFHGQVLQRNEVRYLC